LIFNYFLMKAIILPDYNANIIRAMRSLQVQEMDIPEPVNGQVLVKVAAATCNPSDIAFMRGVYNIRKPAPVIMGFECTGTVVEAGNDPQARALLGKRVSCFSQSGGQGTWAEYFITESSDCLPVQDELDDQQAAGFCINPFTAYALFRLAIEKDSKAIIQNGASGQIGQFIRKLGHANGLPVINLVRKDEHVKSLQDEGERLLINMNDPEFEGKLGKMAHEFQARIAFDAVAGEISGLILNAMPAGAELVIYGGLSGKHTGMINPMDIIFKSKTIRGFNLNQWKQDIGAIRFREISEELQRLITGGLLRTRIQGSFRLDEVQAAMEQYIRNMSSGKILFVP
jgi:NADPH:quinone reductase-like Zn-dependent oxidoreductase